MTPGWKLRMVNGYVCENSVETSVYSLCDEDLGLFYLISRLDPFLGRT